jgi:3-hydroxyacyl-CoA dehydrogenase
MATSEVVGVVGAGTMGAGIAQVASTAGCDVVLFDVRRELGPNRIVAVLRRLGERRPERYPIAPRLLEGNLQ